MKSNDEKMQGLIMGKSKYNYELLFENSATETKGHLKILGIKLDNKLSFQEHIKDILYKVYAKIGAMRRMKRLVPKNTMIALYRSFILPHFEFSNPLFIGLTKTLSNKLEKAGHYGLRTVLNLNNSVSYKSSLKLIDMRSLSNRRIEQSLVIFFKYFKKNGPNYISNFFYAPHSNL